MKIEKINDNQIRCTLSKEDLENRDINVGELVYGTGKTKELFQDMMSKANADFGFEVNDIPLMVEAIPVSPETIVLLITKVDDKKDAESHLSKFFAMKDKNAITPDGAQHDYDSLLDFEGDVDKLYDDLEEVDILDEEDPFWGIYVFNSLSEVIFVSKLLAPFFKGTSSLSKSPYDNRYYMAIFLEDPKNDALSNKLDSVLLEYGESEFRSNLRYQYILEHYDLLIADNAINNLGTI